MRSAASSATCSSQAASSGGRLLSPSAASEAHDVMPLGMSKTDAQAPRWACCAPRRSSDATAAASPWSRASPSGVTWPRSDNGPRATPPRVSRPSAPPWAVNKLASTCPGDVSPPWWWAADMRARAAGDCDVSTPHGPYTAPTPRAAVLLRAPLAAVDAARASDRASTMAPWRRRAAAPSGVSLYSPGSSAGPQRRPRSSVGVKLPLRVDDVACRVRSKTSTVSALAPAAAAVCSCDAVHSSVPPSGPVHVARAEEGATARSTAATCVPPPLPPDLAVCALASSARPAGVAPARRVKPQAEVATAAGQDVGCVARRAVKSRPFFAVRAPRTRAPSLEKVAVTRSGCVHERDVATTRAGGPHDREAHNECASSPSAASPAAKSSCAEQAAMPAGLAHIRATSPAALRGSATNDNTCCPSLLAATNAGWSRGSAAIREHADMPA